MHVLARLSGCASLIQMRWMGTSMLKLQLTTVDGCVPAVCLVERLLLRGRLPRHAVANAVVYAVSTWWRGGSYGGASRGCGRFVLGGCGPPEARSCINLGERLALQCASQG